MGIWRILRYKSGDQMLTPYLYNFVTFFQLYHQQIRSHFITKFRANLLPNLNSFGHRNHSHFSKKFNRLLPPNLDLFGHQVLANIPGDSELTYQQIWTHIFTKFIAILIGDSKPFCFEIRSQFYYRICVDFFII